MSSATSHAIKHRKVPKDVYLTPIAVASNMIKSIPAIEGEHWFDPFRGGGVFYDNYPVNVVKDYTEIAEGKDFFQYSGKADVIVSNPPFSLIDKVLKKTFELKPRVFSYLLLHGAMTPRRMEMIQKAGYGMIQIHSCKVFDWYGMAQFYTFGLGAPDLARITFDRVVHRLTEAENTLQQRLQDEEEKRAAKK